MKLIVGLGNPGKEYTNTRHNAGFMAIDKVASELNVDIKENKFKALIGVTTIKGEKTILMKPQTYMNNSGEAVRACVDFYKIPVEDILVMHDDLDLPVGKLRIRMQGSAGGQKGMKSIIDHLCTQNINRIRIGIDKNPNIPIVDYVLGKIEKENIPLFNESTDSASKAAVEFITTPIQDVMNHFNKKI